MTLDKDILPKVPAIFLKKVISWLNIEKFEFYRHL